MFDKVQRDRFWLVLGAVLIALFVVQKERGLGGSGPETRQETRVYDRGGMTRLVEKAIEIPVVAPVPAARPQQRAQFQYASWSDPHADLVTGSIAATAPRPLARPGRGGGAVEVASLAAPSGRYYAQLGSYSTIDRASRRYFDILGREPDLKGSERVGIDTARVSGEEVHRVRMGPFASENSARAACARAAIPADECAVVALN
ncbi:MAG: SPOR domain-containing protein [Parvibaculum sp.]